jgi:hypothetical protein
MKKYVIKGIVAILVLVIGVTVVYQITDKLLGQEHAVFAANGAKWKDQDAKKKNADKDGDGYVSDRERRAQEKKNKEEEAEKKAKQDYKEWLLDGTAKTKWELDFRIKYGIKCDEGKGPAGSKTSCAVVASPNGAKECGAGSAGAVKVMCGGASCGSVVTGGGVTCENARSFCPPESCKCEATSCAQGNPSNKFMTLPASNGTKINCDKCQGVAVACPATYKNTAPTCSTLPASIEMTRFEAARQFEINVTDQDYGDTVQIVDVRVVDDVGNLKSCVNVKSLSGSSLSNMIVKAGSDNPADISARTVLTADAREAHGVYGYDANGVSVCSGYIAVKVVDIDSDGNGPDVPGSATCRVNLRVTNNNPVVSEVEVIDQDPIIELRDPATNMLATANTASPLFIGSSSETRRAGRCNAALNFDPLGQCPDGQFAPQVTKRNPFRLSMTVSDADGIQDIKDFGFWLQRADTTSTADIFPVIQTEGRLSVQALVGVRNDYNIDNVNYLSDNTCLGPNCTTDVTETGSLLGISGIVTKGLLVPQNGTITATAQKRVSYATWLGAGWPDCYNRGVIGCTIDNVPTGARIPAGTTESDGGNFDWLVSSDKSNMLCLSGRASTASVVPKEGICPSTCAACVTLESLTRTSATALKAAFRITMNDKEATNSQHGMIAGKYSLLVGAVDKVAGYANGASMYKVARNANAQEAHIVFDPMPPTISLSLTNPAGTNVMEADVMLSESSIGSGIAGKAIRFMVKEDYANPEDVSGTLSFLNTSDGGSGLWNGLADFVPAASSGNQSADFTGYGLTSESGIAAGICAYDRAGNMCCAKTVAAGVTSACPTSGTSGIYGYGTSWLQTSLASVYSNNSESGAAFAMTVPEKSMALSALPVGFTQSGSAVSNMVITAGSDVGINGGKDAGSGTYTPLGFALGSSNYYRKSDSNSAFNVTTVNDSTRDTWYSILYAQSTKFCETAGSCIVSSNLSDTAVDAPYKIIRLNSAAQYTENIVCKGANVIFITGKVTVSVAGQVTKDSTNSGCLFVVDNESKFIIADSATGKKTGAPAVDLFEGNVVVSKGGSFATRQVSTLKTIVFDRLEWRGFLYDDSGTAPVFGRHLTLDHNKEYPAEWLIFDATVLDTYRMLLGYEKTVDVVCGTSQHILCRGK